MSGWDFNQSVKKNIQSSFINDDVGRSSKITFCSKSAELSPRGRWKNACIIYPVGTSVTLLAEQWTGWVLLC